MCVFLRLRWKECLQRVSWVSKSRSEGLLYLQGDREEESQGLISIGLISIGLISIETYLS